MTRSRFQQGSVEAVSCGPSHDFSKAVQQRIRLIAGLGVQGDAHAGVTVKHRSRVQQDPTQPNLRQVHLIHAELREELRAAGFSIAPGDLGENLLTRGIDLLGLAPGTRLLIGDHAEVQITGLRNPCGQIENFRSGLLKAVLEKDDKGNIIRKAGVMGIVLSSGDVMCGDAISIELPPAPHERLVPV